jgi:gamma-glutamyltranspeptidase/glutathione hydrolase
MKTFQLPAQLDHRPPTMGLAGMAATSQPLATLAAVDVLRSGGSAVDAAIAANAVLSLLEPHMCGPGGDLFALVFDPRTGALDGLNASGRAPLAQSRAQLQSSLGAARTMPARGPFSVTSPGAVAGWSALHERYGRLPWAQLFAPAIRLAENGFAVGARSSLWWRRAAAEITAEAREHPGTAGFEAVFGLRGGPQPGERRDNPGMASLYRQLAAEGTALFRAGPVVDAIVHTVRVAGGTFDAADLGAVTAEWTSPLSIAYRGCTVHALPPNGQGLSLLQMLGMLECLPATRDGTQMDADWWHVYLEAKKLAFADRARWFADPDFAEIPCDSLLSPAYLARRLEHIDMTRAADDATPGEVHVPESDTTYLAVADADGVMVSLIQSLFTPFGSGLVVPGFGFALQSRASGFSLQDGHPNVYAPGKRPFHTIMPGFVTHEGQALMALGAIGGDMQPQAQAQILARLLVEGCDVQRAGAAPRLRHLGGLTPTGLREPTPGTVLYEAEFNPDLIEELRHRGHTLAPLADPVGSFVGGYQGIIRNPDGHALWGGSDHRLDGCALGF